MYWMFLLLAIGISILGQGLLKAGAGSGTFLLQITNWRTIIGLGVYGFSAILYIVSLRRIPISVALPCTALSYIIVALIGHFMFAEALGPARLVGLGLIGTGVAVLAAS